MKNPWDLFDARMSFEEIVDTVPWMMDTDRDMIFIEEFLNFAEKWATPEQKAGWKKYYGKVAACKRAAKCHTSHHTPSQRLTDSRLHWDPALTRTQPSPRNIHTILRKR
jgi:hypothetical protein